MKAPELGGDAFKALKNQLRTADQESLAEIAIRAGVLTSDQVTQAMEKALAEGANLMDWLVRQEWLSVEDVALLREAPVRPSEDKPTTLVVLPHPEVLSARRDPSRIFGRYILVELVGKGALGTVWRAWDDRLQRWVAVKLPQGPPNAPEARRFLREARIAAQLKHPNLVAVHDAGEIAGRPYLVMDLVRGIPLEGEGDPRKAVVIVRKVALALHEAHKSGVIHRDLKPANILVDAKGEPCVVDFGLALLENPITSSRKLRPAGTPAYMAPEQFDSSHGSITAQTDVYALGGVLYRLFTGRPPVAATEYDEIRRRVLEEPPLPPGQLCPGLSPDLEAVVLKCLEKSAGRRYGSASELADDLGRWLAGEPVAARSHRMDTRVMRLVKRNRIRTAAILTASVAVVCVAVAWGVRESSSRREEQTRLQLNVLWSSIRDRHFQLRAGRMEPESAREEVQRAEREIDAFIDRHPDRPMAFYARGWSRYRMKDLKGAMSDLERSVGIDPAFRPGWSLLGIVRVELFLDQLMLSTIGCTIGTALGDVSHRWDGLRLSALDALQRGYDAGREKEEWERWGLAWTREDRDMATTAQAMKHVFGGTSDGDAANAVLRSAEVDAGGEEIALVQGRIAPSGSAGIVCYTRALEIAGGHGQAWLLRSVARLMSNDLDGALEDSTQALRWLGEVPQAFYWRSLILSERGDAERAIQDLDVAIDLDGGFAEAWWLRGEINWSLHRTNSAISDLSRALEIMPDLTNALASRGIAWGEGMGDWTKGEQDLRAALAKCLPSWHRRQEIEERLQARGRRDGESVTPPRK